MWRCGWPLALALVTACSDDGVGKLTVPGDLDGAQDTDGPPSDDQLPSWDTGEAPPHSGSGDPGDEGGGGDGDTDGSAAGSDGPGPAEGSFPGSGGSGPGSWTSSGTTHPGPPSDTDLPASGDGTCDLGLDVTCRVAPPPHVSVDACDGKLTGLRLRYTGAGCAATTQLQSGKLTCTGDAAFAEPVDVVVRNETGAAVYARSAAVRIGDEVVATAAAAGLSSFENATFVEIDGGLELLDLHTSCSQPIGPGDQFGSWTVIEVTSTLGGVVTYAPPAPEVSADACELDPVPPAPHCTSRPVAIQWRYVGGDCSHLTQDQHGHARCTDHGPTTADARVVMTDRPTEVYVDVADVGFGDVIEATAAHAGLAEFKANTRVSVFDDAGTLVQSLEVQTSCDQPLDLGDRFGALEVVGLDGKDDPPVALYTDVLLTYTVDNAAAVDVTDVVVTDDQLGEVGTVAGIGAGEAVELSRTVRLFEPTTFDVVATSLASGLATCAASDSLSVGSSP
jgi:hypothetical protein